MFDEPFRARFGRAFRSAVPLLVRVGIKPNHVTVATFLLAVVAAVLVGAGRPVAGLTVWLISRFGDGVDGLLARQTGRRTAFGGYLDISLDMAGYAGMIVGFAVLHPAFHVAWAAVLAGYVVVITTTLALSDAAGQLQRRVAERDRTFQFTAGVAEAGETNVMYALWVLFPASIGWLVWLWVAALFFTAIQRTWLAWRVLREGGR